MVYSTLGHPAHQSPKKPKTNKEKQAEFFDLAISILEDFHKNASKILIAIETTIKLLKIAREKAC